MHRDVQLQAPGKLEKFILVWVHTIMGSGSATWHTLHSHPSSSLTGLSLPTYAHEFGKDRGVCVSVCVCVCVHAQIFKCLPLYLVGYQNPLVCF